jgi:hypothetical protein
VLKQVGKLLPVGFKGLNTINIGLTVFTFVTVMWYVLLQVGTAFFDII